MSHRNKSTRRRRSATRLLHVSLVWLLVDGAARSRRPDRALRKALPGISSALTVVPLAAASLIVGEFPIHVLLTQIAVTAVLVSGGALRERRGVAGLVVAATGWACLLASQHDSKRAADVLESSLREGLGTDYQGDRASTNAERAVSWRDIWFPRFSERRRYLRHADLSYGDAGVRNYLDIWRRADLPLDGAAPVLLQIHGSGWVAGSKRGQGYPLMAHMAERGWVCVAINYSLAPRARWPAHIIDVKRAIAWIRRNIADYGGDPQFVVVTGGSAGGHLSALAALSANDPIFQPGFEDADTSLVAAVPLYGVYDLLDRAGDSPREQEEYLRRIVIGTSREQAHHVWDKGSPLSWVGRDAPPMFVVHGGIDTFTNPEQARAFVGALQQVSSAPVVYAELPGAQHAFDWLPSVRTRATVEAIDRFLTYVRESAQRQPR